jgi:hypothetical protein
MSGIQSPEPPPPDAVFPAVGQYDYVPGPGDEGYVEPEAEPDETEGLDDDGGELDDEG